MAPTSQVLSSAGVTGMCHRAQFYMVGLKPQDDLHRRRAFCQLSFIPRPVCSIFFSEKGTSEENSSGSTAKRNSGHVPGATQTSGHSADKLLEWNEDAGGSQWEHGYEAANLASHRGEHQTADLHGDLTHVPSPTPPHRENDSPHPSRPAGAELTHPPALSALWLL